MNFLIFIGAIVCSLIFFGGALYLYVVFSSNKINLPFFDFSSHKGDKYNKLENSIDTSTTKILQSLDDAKVNIRQILSNKEYRAIEESLTEIVKVLNKLSYDMNQRFETIEFFLNEIKSSKVTESAVKINLTTTELEGYFGFPISQKYLKFQRNYTDGCFFKASINKDKGTFDLISLEKIKSEEGLDNVVKFVGNIRKSEATFHKVTQVGIVSKVDDKDMWKIEKPLIVELS